MTGPYTDNETAAGRGEDAGVDVDPADRSATGEPTEPPPAGTGRRRGRPRTPVLSQDAITRMTLRLITRRGYDAFTLAALAKELRVSVSALYNHAASKQQVLLWAQDSINATIDTSPFATLPWDEALAVWARSYRAAYAAFTPLIPVMAVLPVTDAPGSLAMYETVVAALVSAGWSGGEAVNAVVAVESFVFGSALDTAAPADIFDVSEDAAPVFAAAVADRRRRYGHGEATADAAFELGLNALLSGLRARHASGA